ncbi:hypothetical protein [Nitrosospira multiformis]|uniref:hypothetical protein n=1 Tax=Nitrosospira multiformis TaxID=1231 RepID=UPI000A83BBF4
MEFVPAMKQGLVLNKILGTIHTYPTYPGPANMRQMNGDALICLPICCIGWKVPCLRCG